MKKYKVEYSSNNSGGSWWLTDQNWYDLQKAGWNVGFLKDRRFGALATKCFRIIEAPDIKAAMKTAVQEWERITNQDPSDEGCNCCGEPHTFEATGLDEAENESMFLGAHNFSQHVRIDPWD